MGKQNDSSAPPISHAVIEWLMRLYPDSVPTLEMTHREVWFAAGRQDVIRKLKAEYKLQRTPSENDG